MARKNTPNSPADFWAQVDKQGPDDCWEWRAGTNLQGYGRMSLGGKGSEQASHRNAWILTYGPIPEGLLVCHHCDNPACCNPAHLFVGTYSDNLRDAIIKGRAVWPPLKELGWRPASTKLTNNQVIAMRDLYATGRYTYQMIGALFDAHKRTVGDAVTGRTWAHLPFPAS